MNHVEGSTVSVLLRFLFFAVWMSRFSLSSWTLSRPLGTVCMGCYSDKFCCLLHFYERWFWFKHIFQVVKEWLEKTFYKYLINLISFTRRFPFEKLNNISLESNIIVKWSRISFLKDSNKSRFKGNDPEDHFPLLVCKFTIWIA